MTKSRAYYGLLGLILLGAVVAFGSVILTSWELAVAAAVSGTFLIFGALTAIYFVIDEEIEFFVAFGEPRYDERTKQIEARAARNAYVVVLALMMAGMIAFPSMPTQPAANVVLIALTFSSLATLGVSTKVYRSRM